MATSPYTYQSLTNLQSQKDAALHQAWYWMDQYRKQPHNAAIAYQRMNALRNARNLQGNFGTYEKNWEAGGRQGALEAVQKKFGTVESLLPKLTPFDPQASMENINSKRLYDQNLINLQGQENLLGQQYGTSRRQYEQKIPDMARQLLNSYASRGMAQSTGYGSAVGQQQTDIADQLSNLDMQRQQALADITGQRGLLKTGYQSDLASTLFGAISRMSSKAGTLGLSRSRGMDIYNDPQLLIKLAQKLLTSGG